MKLGRDVVKKVPAKDGGYFIVKKRDVTRGAGPQDPFKMFHVQKNGKVVDWGTHPSLKGALKFAKRHGIIESESATLPELLEDIRDDMLGEAKMAPLGAINKLARGLAKHLNQSEYGFTNAGKVSRKGSVWSFMATGVRLQTIQDEIKAALKLVGKKYGPVRTWGHQAAQLSNYMVGPEGKQIGVGAEYRHGKRLGVLVSVGRGEEAMRFGV
jgi:hypothetical protein